MVNLNYCKFYMKTHWQILFFALLYVIGLLTGTIFVRLSSTETLDILSDIAGGFFKSRCYWSFGAVFASSLFSSLSFLVILFLCGFCTLGRPLISAAIFFRGLGTGFFQSYFYAVNGIQAIPYVVAVITPATILYALIFLLGARYSAQLSAESSKRTRQAVDSGTVSHIPAYCMIYLFLALLTGLVAGLDGGISVWLSKINL